MWPNWDDGNMPKEYYKLAVWTVKSKSFIISLILIEEFDHS